MTRNLSSLLVLVAAFGFGQTPEALLQRGMQQGEQRDFAGAAQSFSAAIARNPKYDRAYYFRAQAYKYLRQYPAAIADLDRALQLRPFYNVYIAEKVEIFRETGDLDRALLEADNMLIIMPKLEVVNPLAFPLRGSVFQAMGLEREAEQEYAYGKYEANLHRHGLNNAIEQTNQHIARYRAVPRSAAWRPRAGAGHADGLRALDAGQNRTAIAHFDAALRTGPERVESYFFRGMAYYRLRQYARAADDMQKVLRLDPNHAGAASYMGMATWSFGDREGAIRHYTTAIRLQPRWGTPYYNRALALVAAKNYNAALADLNMQLQLEPKSGAGLADRAMVQYRLGNPGAAMADLKAAIALNPRAARLYCNMGVIVADQNRAQAHQWYERCYALDPLERSWYEGQEKWADAYMAFQRRMADIMAAIASDRSSSGSGSGCPYGSAGACSAWNGGDDSAAKRFENGSPSARDRNSYGH
ncbi:MAG: tetratricopeptide repeat protein [Acidobacteria bacterium]|nr:tetratricopeptide repeat protein [Acidobacteriota bacterium]